MCVYRQKGIATKILYTGLHINTYKKTDLYARLDELCKDYCNFQYLNLHINAVWDYCEGPVQIIVTYCAINNSLVVVLMSRH